MYVKSINATSLGLLIAAVLVALPFGASSYTTFVAAQMIAMLYIAMALELSHSFARALSFCTGTFFAVGAYAAFYLASYVSSELTFVLAGSCVVAAIAGSAVALMVVRMKGVHSAVVGTLAIGAIALLVANALADYTGGEDGLSLHRGLTLFGIGTEVGVSKTTYYLALVPVIIYLVSYLFCRSTAFGTTMRAVGENDTRSELLGFNVELRRIVVFSVAAGISGYGGAMYFVLAGHISTALFDPTLSLNGVLWATVGGLRSPFGALIGTVMIYPAVELAAGFFRYVDALIGALLIGTALLFPHGIAGALDRSADPRPEADSEFSAGQTGLNLLSE